MTRALRLLTIAFLLSLSTATTAQTPAPSWTQWGGPTRDFMVPSTGLANSWPAGGPKRLWARPLGEGHSAILVRERPPLYAVSPPRCDAAQPGRNRHRARCRDRSDHLGTSLSLARPPASTFSEGAGPHATPLIAGNRAVSSSASRREFMALDKAHRQGAVVARSDQGVPRAGRRSRHGEQPAAVQQHDPPADRRARPGARRPSIPTPARCCGRPATPPTHRRHRSLIDVDGQKQVVLFGGDRIVGLDPSNGTELWNHPHRTDWGLNISTPVWNPADHLLLFSSAYGTGSRALELRQASGKTTVKEVWAVSRVRVHIGSIIRVGDTAYMSSGDFGPAFLTADQREDRRHRVAGSRLCPRAAALRRRQADRAR